MSQFELILDSDHANPRRIPVNGAEMIIGRSSSADIRIKDERVSRKHARVWVEGGRLQIEDLGSRHGIDYNGQRVQHADLQNGDSFGVGGNTFRVADKSGATAAPRSPEPPRENLPKSGFDMRELEQAFDTRSAARRQAAETPPKPAEAQQPAAGDRPATPPASPAHTYFDRITRAFARQIVEKAMKASAGRRVLVASAQKDGEPHLVSHRAVDVTTEGPSINRSIIEHVMETGRAMIKATPSDTRELQDSKRPFDRDGMCAPIIGRSGIYGVIYADLPKSKQGFTEPDLERLSELGNRAGGVLDSQH